MTIWYELLTPVGPRVVTEIPPTVKGEIRKVVIPSGSAVVWCDCGKGMNYDNPITTFYDHETLGDKTVPEELEYNYRNYSPGEDCICPVGDIREWEETTEGEEVVE